MFVLLKISPFFVANVHCSERRNTTDGAGSMKILPNNSISLSVPPHSNVASGSPYSTTFSQNTLKKANSLGIQRKSQIVKSNSHASVFFQLQQKKGNSSGNNSAEELNQRLRNTLLKYMSSIFAQQGCAVSIILKSMFKKLKTCRPKLLSQSQTLSDKP